MRTQRVRDVDVIRDHVEIPGFGALPVNAFVIHADQPVLVDTGRPVEKAAFLDALWSVVDPAELRWIWLSHPDRDHMGALFDVLAAAPQARLVSTFLAVGYLTVEFDVPLDRVQLVNPGQSLAVGGGRALHAFRPPLFDSPMTVGFYDDGNGVCFSSDCFGALLPETGVADAPDVRELPPAVVRDSQLAWATADSPWVHQVDPAKFAATYAHLGERRPEVVLSTHLPPASAAVDQLLDMLTALPSAPPFMGPDHGTLEAMLSGAITIPDQAAEAGARSPA